MNFKLAKDMKGLARESAGSSQVMNLDKYVAQAIEKAAKNGLSQLSLEIPLAASGMQIVATERALQKNGYTVSTQQDEGILEAGLYYRPKTHLFIRWG